MNSVRTIGIPEIMKQTGLSRFKVMKLVFTPGAKGMLPKKKGEKYKFIEYDFWSWYEGQVLQK